MSFGLSLALQGRLAEHMAAEASAIRSGIRTAVGEGAADVQNALRAMVGTRFRSRRAANAIRKRLYDNAAGGTAGIVWSALGRRDSSGKLVDYLAAHVTGATIRPKGSRLLYIPLTGGRRAKTSRLAVASAKNLAFIPIGGGRILIVRKGKTRSTPIAILVRMVRIPKSINLDAVIRREESRLPARLAQALDRAR